MLLNAGNFAKMTKAGQFKVGDLIGFTKTSRLFAYKVDNVLSCVLEAVDPPSLPPSIRDGGWLPISVKAAGLVLKDVGFRLNLRFSAGRETVIVLFGDKIVYVDKFQIGKL